METMYDVACMSLHMKNTTVSKKNLDSCIITHRPGSEFLQTAVVPMWVVYQFLVSVVLLRILIVMLTITYNKILANLNTQWKYARIYLVIQFFDVDSLLPPPFTFLTLIMYLIRKVAKTKCFKMAAAGNSSKKYKHCAAIDIEYRTLIFSFIDNVKPAPDTGIKGNNQMNHNYCNELFEIIQTTLGMNQTSGTFKFIWGRPCPHPLEPNYSILFYSVGRNNQ